MNPEKTVNGVTYEHLELDGLIEVKQGNQSLGYIRSENGEWEAIQNGADPIAEDWENGQGVAVAYMLPIAS